MITNERLQLMADALVRVPGLEAVVLGGSRARGTHHDGSDVDLGLYYRAEDLDHNALTRETGAFSDAGRVEVAGPGGWGPWVNGGGWLTVDGTPVDWILRDLARVREQCHRAVAGEYAFHSQPGHPLGFLDVSYAGEIATCVPLADPEGVIADLRTTLDPYPRALRTALVDNLWQARFLVDAARKGLPKGDSAYVMLCCSTALMVCAHAWHAVAGSWPTNEKGLVVDVARLDLDSHDFSARADDAMRRAGHDDGSLEAVIDRVAQLVAETQRTLDTRP
ncbi:nucleotidyltransferase domain-containing protein [Humibacillus xanthopallidus]|uniref:Nucleotidyltransferase-like protein n=1 Tax=Humibacillus xanthopallidus TaxID=412689 RepID=A0A543I0W5_9MICO|nr:nucleotidyltransferase domain-containing protein [Humibacillus xanthopallidus]TQM64239.1 nucleotidyltransferase-like protein [Humibacillus xanthopallidus]